MRRHHHYRGPRLKVEQLETRLMLAADPVLDPDFGDPDDPGVVFVPHPGLDLLTGNPTEMVIQPDGKSSGWASWSTVTRSANLNCCDSIRMVLSTRALELVVEL